MYRRSLTALAPQGRAIVRDPRKVKIAATSAPSTNSNTAVANQPIESPSPIVPHQNQSPLPSQHQQQPIPFAPTEQNQNSIGSMVGSYMLAGFGMGLGMILVRIVLGG